MEKLLKDITACQICKATLPNQPKPIIALSEHSKILIIGQAPGRVVHNTEIAWNDASGNELRRWLGVNRKQFYNTDFFATMPMGFCYPGTGKNGDLPPKKECAPTWHDLLLNKMKNIELTLLIGSYAQKHYLKSKKNLTENVKNFEQHFPSVLALPHPSPRNRLWQKKNPWFELDIVPLLQVRVQEII